jgi:hypothetical protein
MAVHPSLTATSETLYRTGSSMKMGSVTSIQNMKVDMAPGLLCQLLARTAMVHSITSAYRPSKACRREGGGEGGAVGGRREHRVSWGEGGRLGRAWCRLSSRTCSQWRGRKAGSPQGLRTLYT